MDNERTPEELDELWRREQLRLGEEALRGMLSNDFGNGSGEFIEPVRGLDPVNYQLPEDEKLLAMATSEILVSAGEPAVEFERPAEEPPPGPEDFEEFTEPADEPLPPLPDSEPIEFGRSEDTASFQRFQRDANFLQGLEVSIDPDPVAPRRRSGLAGLHAGVEKPRTREQRQQQAQEAIRQRRERPADALPPPPQQQPSNEQAEVAPPPPPGEPAEDLPPPQQVHLPPELEMPDVEHGMSGDSFFEDEDRTTNARDQLIGMAVDSITSKDEMVLEMLRRLVSMTERNKEGLQQLLDQTESEEEDDEF